MWLLSHKPQTRLGLQTLSQAKEIYILLKRDPKGCLWVVSADLEFHQERSFEYKSAVYLNCPTNHLLLHLLLEHCLACRLSQEDSENPN